MVFNNKKNTIKWQEIIPLLGKKTDSEISLEFNVSREWVSAKRRRLGISKAKYNHSSNIKNKMTKIKWEEIVPLIGTMCDSEIGKKYNISKEMVGIKRRSLSISPVWSFQHKTIKWIPSEYARKKTGERAKNNKYCLGRRMSDSERKIRSQIMRKCSAEHPDKWRRAIEALRKYVLNPEFRKVQAERMRSLTYFSKMYETPIGKVQGKCELKYINNLIENNKKLPTIPKEGIWTDFGYYFPDFEYEDRYVEIKSKYTYDVCIGKIAFHGQGNPTDRQMKKINYVRDFYKPVEIIII